MIRVFISSVQKEFAEERKALVKYIREDVLLCKFFQPFIFEELPAINLSAPQAYLYEAAHSVSILASSGRSMAMKTKKAFPQLNGNMILPSRTASIGLFS